MEETEREREHVLHHQHDRDREHNRQSSSTLSSTSTSTSTSICVDDHDHDTDRHNESFLPECSIVSDLTNEFVTTNKRDRNNARLCTTTNISNQQSNAHVQSVLQLQQKYEQEQKSPTFNIRIQIYTGATIILTIKKPIETNLKPGSPAFEKLTENEITIG
jgi:hypothetical protein